MTKPTIITALPQRRDTAPASDRKLTVVAGGAGFIGSHLCRALLGRGEAVLCLERAGLIGRVRGDGGHRCGGIGNPVCCEGGGGGGYGRGQGWNAP